MTEDIALPAKTPLRRRALRDAVASRPIAFAVCLYALVALAAALAAYFAIFSQFAAYDDEGTLLVTLKAFVHGEALYRDIYTAYGPFYYELFGGLFALTGHAVTNDAGRSIVIVIWVGVSLLFGLVAQRLTGLLALGVTGMIAAFAVLRVLVSEPMHPHGLCVLLLGAFALLAVRGPGRRVVLLGGACGALLAALALSKINLGIFALAAVALAAVLSAEPLYRHRWVRWPVIAAFLALPLLVMGRDLNEGWVRDLAMYEALAGTAIVVAAWPDRPKREADDRALVRWLCGAAAGFGLAFVAIIGVMLLLGPTPADIYDGIVGEALRVRNVLLIPFPLPVAAVDWGIAAVAAAALTARLRSGGDGVPPIWSGLLRAAAGLAIWCAVARIAPLSLGPSGGSPNVLPLALAWVAAIPPTIERESSYRRFLRIFFPALAVAETLQVYPVPGSQMGIAALTFVPVGALCLGDALVCLRAWAAARGPVAVGRLSAITGIVVAALAVTFAVDSIARPAASDAVLYRHQDALSLPGATLLRLPAADVDTYTGIVDLLHRHRCTAFIGYPSINSIYLWSSIDAPAPTAPGAWMNMLDDERQQRMVDELRGSPRPCAIRSDGRAAGWLKGAPPPQSPLVRYIFDDFRPVATIGDFTFLVARGPSPH